MQDTRIYIVIHGQNKKQKLEIIGDFETLRALLLETGIFENKDAAPITAQPIEHSNEITAELQPA